jgi:hypothetical protein
VSESAGPRSERFERAQWLPVVVATIAAATLIMRADRPWSFFLDEWGTIAYRRSGGVSAFLAPHNGHLQLVVIAIYRALFATVGLRHYWPYEAVNLTLQAALALLVFGYARRRTHPLVAMAFMLVVLLDSDGWQVLLWAINIGFVVPMLSLVVCLLIWRQPARPRVDATMALLVALALASSGLGLAVVTGVAVLVVASPDRWRRAWIVLVPGGLYLLWYVAYRPHALPPANLRHVPGAEPSGDVGFFGTRWQVAKLPGYVARLAEASANALVGASVDSGFVAVIVFAAIVVGLTVWRRRVTAEGVALLVALLTFWITLGLTRLDLVMPTTAGGSRYAYPGAVMLGLLVVEALAGMTWRLPAAAGIACLALIALHSDEGNLQNIWRGTSVSFGLQNAQLRAVQCHPHRFATMRQIDPGGAPGLTAPVYLAAVRDLGSPPDQTCRR